MSSRNTEDVYKIPFNHTDKTSKVVIIDADTLTYMASYTGRDEFGNKKPDYTEEEYYIAETILTESLLKIYNAIEEHYEIKDIFICVKGKNNFRRALYNEYKATRPTVLPIVNHLHKFLIECHSAIVTPYGEADDLVYSLSKKFNHEGIIVSVDGDLLQIPSLNYNPRKEDWRHPTIKEAKYHLVMKVLCGDTGDNVKINHGLGPTKAAKLVNIDMTDYQYIKAIYKTYIKFNGEKDAKFLLKRTYLLLKLHDIL